MRRKKNNEWNPLKGKAHRANSIDPQVARIMNTMLDAEWVPGRSDVEIAEEYEVDLTTVRHWAAQAGRFIRMCHGKRDEIRDRHLAGIEAVFQKALSRKSTFKTKEGLIDVDDPDLRVALSSIELSLKLNHLLNREEDPPKTEVALEELAEILRAHGYKTEAPKKREKNGSKKGKKGA